MATSLLGDIKTQLTPDMVRHLSSPAELAGVLGLNSEMNLSEANTDTATGMAQNGGAWERWEERGKRSARPPWWALLLGIMALSVVYWLWGQGTAVLT